MKISLEKHITLASPRKLIGSSKVFKVFARSEGTATFKVETDDAEQQKVELTISNDAELKVNDLLFGSHGAVSVSKDKVEFKLGIEDFEVTFEPSLANPVSFHVPAIELPVAGQVFKLEEELPALGLTGTAELELEFVIEVHPNYRELARVLKPSNVRAALQTAKNRLYRVARKGKAVGTIVVKAGRAAVYAPFRWLGNGIGRRLAIDALKLGSQTAALGNLLRSAGRLIGAAGIVLESWLIVKDAVPGELAAQHKTVIDTINDMFVDEYAKTLALYTDARAPLSVLFSARAMVAERVLDAPPDIYGVIERLSITQDVTPPTKSGYEWVKDKVANGIRYRREVMLLGEADWQSLYREVYNIYFLFEHAARKATGPQLARTAMDAIRKAGKLLEVAAVVAASQDVLAYVVASSLFEDANGNSPADPWEGWRNVAEFHRAVFGDNMDARILQYKSLIDVSSLRISIPPFGDYADWGG